MTKEEKEYYDFLKTHDDLKTDKEKKEWSVLYPKKRSAFLKSKKKEFDKLSPKEQYEEFVEEIKGTLHSKFYSLCSGEYGFLEVDELIESVKEDEWTEFYGDIPEEWNDKVTEDIHLIYSDVMDKCFN
jgi:hypothetical protein|tara:strand:- start:509 stop:892 length:384 start_codon:yes stop_codon:yes gene_type:complete